MVQEMRVALRNAGKIDPNEIGDYMRSGGYEALSKARQLGQEKLIREIEQSGKLRGRGGAGFNTGLKWRSAAEAEAGEKYVICNADEGEPGTYKDRIIMEQDPHSVIEGMLICAQAIGATEGYVYCRGEYENSRRLLRQAVKQAEEKGVTGGVSLTVVSGAGSYVCGEETALIESLEGRRGEPRLKPPYPTVEGFCGRPTVVNNVETFATIPSIVANGASWFRQIGKAEYPGTKIFCLSGDVVRRTYGEVPTDTTLREIIYGLGGGIAGGGKLKAVQVGGSSCAFLPADQIGTTVDFESLARQGGALGSGSVLVIDDSHNLVNVLVPITRFFAHESCGKCVPCREGTTRLADLIGVIAEGQGTWSDVQLVKRLAAHLKTASFCPLGQSAATAVSSVLELFPEDFAAKLPQEEVKSCV